jgi:superfamily II DNA or RNA helicase/HKD family nuclease
MSESIIEELGRSLQTGFIDKSIQSEFIYQPELIVNRKNPRKKVLTTILNELENCEEFYISVAFATAGGVAALINNFKALEDRRVKGKILVSQYLNFTQPEALKRLLQFKNIELRISVSENSHSKGYIFKTNSHYNLIIGSSNLTQSALATNKEWNLKVSGISTSNIVDKVLEEFEHDFDKGVKVTQDYIIRYEKLYERQFLRYALNSKDDLSEGNLAKVSPNSMQIEALDNLKKQREKNKNKSLLISATGTGKTYLSAFDAKAFNPKKILFVVHRLNIAKSALKTFKKVFGSEKSMGIYSGNRKEFEKDFLFATVQTISKFSELHKFNKNHFDYIIIDESHRSSSGSYLRMMDYFEPQFLLGMTATPERTDAGDIFKLFDYNIAYEIRLNRAMEEEMLSPFHYFGVTDLYVDDEIREKDSDFNLLLEDERVDRIIEKIKFYGCDTGVVNGLIFCSDNKESKELSEKFNARGYKTISLTGDSSEEERVEAINRLESNNSNDKIDYIFTRDIFNEGIDIPKVNQIIMLRPTQSAIVFVQQLGRGLRKIDGKEYLTVIDFIGNYKNNYMIPIALYGDTSFNKDKLRKLISSGSSTIPGVSTINFDEVSKQKIYDAIDSAKLKLLVDLKKDYIYLKNRFGRTPMMMDFINSKSRDPFFYVEYSKSYYNFICKVDDNFIDELSLIQKELLVLFSNEINNAKRIEETIILKNILQNNELDVEVFRENVLKDYGFSVTDETIHSCLINLNFIFVGKESNIAQLIDSKYVIHGDFKNELDNKVFKTFLEDTIEYAIATFEKLFSFENYRNGFVLYNKYTRKDVCRILNWDKNYESTVYGYKISKGSAPLFVTYKKDEGISSTTKYNDHFVNRNEFAWESKSNRTLKSSEIIKLSNSKEENLRVLLFIQKSNDEGTDFYFVGDLEVIKESIRQDSKINEKTNKNIPVVHFNYRLVDSVEDSLYNYIVDKVKTDINSSVAINDVIEPVAEVSQKRYSIPFYKFHAAAGSFSDMQSEKDYTMLDTTEEFDPNEYFACRIIGESMNKTIPNNSICLFRKYSGGSRTGKIVLVENMNIQDPDSNSAFTIKIYASEKVVTEEGYYHTAIVLKPYSFQSDFKNLVLTKDNASAMRTIGVFVKVLD